MTAPVVSVIMAAYRGARLVGETWASLAAQTFRAFELIVVDDCSPDDTLAVLRAIAVTDPRVRVIAAATNGGPVAARNRAFASARGRYVAGLDQDDLCRPERLARQVAYLDAHPDVVLVATAATRLVGRTLLPARPPATTTPALIDWLLGIRNPLVWSSAMLRTEQALSFAPFTRHDRLYAEDFDLYHRLRLRGRIARLDEELTVYRVHADSASQRYRDTMIASTAAILADAHRDLFGAEAEARATLLATHCAAGLPVAGADDLRLFGDTLARVYHRFLAQHRPEARDRALVDADYANSWWSVARAAVRSGALPLARALALRPPGLGIGEAGSADLLLSGVIGRGRALVGGRRA